MVSTTQTKRVPATQRGLMANAVSPVQAADVTGDFVFLEQERSPNRSSREESVVGLGMCLQYLSGSVMIEAVVPGYAAAVGKLEVSNMASPACSCVRALQIYVHAYLCIHICLYVHVHVYVSKQCCDTHACTDVLHIRASVRMTTFMNVVISHTHSGGRYCDGHQWRPRVGQGASVSQKSCSWCRRHRLQCGQFLKTSVHLHHHALFHPRAPRSQL